MAPALTPKIRSKLSGPSNMNASMTPAVKAHRRLPPSRMSVSYGLRESMRPDKIRRMDACNVAASQIPFGTSVAIFFGIAPPKGHACTDIVGAPIRETQSHEHIEGRVNGQEQLCFVEAVNEPWGWVDQHTSFEDVKPRAAEEPGPSKRHAWLQPVQDIGTNGIGRCILSLIHI